MIWLWTILKIFSFNCFFEENERLKGTLKKRKLLSIVKKIQKSQACSDFAGNDTNFSIFWKLLCLWLTFCLHRWVTEFYKNKKRTAVSINSFSRKILSTGAETPWNIEFSSEVFFKNLIPFLCKKKLFISKSENKNFPNELCLFQDVTSRQNKKNDQLSAKRTL